MGSKEWPRTWQIFIHTWVEAGNQGLLEAAGGSNLWQCLVGTIIVTLTLKIKTRAQDLDNENHVFTRSLERLRKKNQISWLIITLAMSELKQRYAYSFHQSLHYYHSLIYVIHWNLFQLELGVGLTIPPTGQKKKTDQETVGATKSSSGSGSEEQTAALDHRFNRSRFQVESTILTKIPSPSHTADRWKRGSTRPFSYFLCVFCDHGTRFSMLSSLFPFPAPSDPGT